MRSGGFVSQRKMRVVVTVELDREMKVSHRRGCEGELKAGYSVVLVQRDGRVEANEEKNLLKLSRVWFVDRQIVRRGREML